MKRNASCNVPVKSKLKHPSRATPGHLNFWKSFVQIPPSRGRKAVQMPHYRYRANTEQIQSKYRAKLVQAFAFQPVRHESGTFCFECIEACLRHDLSRHLESARRNMKSKLAIKFPTPYE